MHGTCDGADRAGFIPVGECLHNAQLLTRILRCLRFSISSRLKHICKGMVMVVNIVCNVSTSSSSSVFGVYLQEYCK